MMVKLCLEDNSQIRNATRAYAVHFEGAQTTDGWSPEHIGAGAAVVAVHVLLVWFVYVALTEDVSDEAEGDDAIINLKNRIKQMEKTVAEVEAEKNAQVRTAHAVPSEDATSASRSLAFVELFGMKG